MRIARVLCIILIVLLHRVMIKRHHFNCIGDEVNDHHNNYIPLFARTHEKTVSLKNFLFLYCFDEEEKMSRFATVTELELEKILENKNGWEADNTVNRFGDGRLSLLFSLAKMISDSACGLVGYHLSRLNKSDNRPCPHRLTV